MKYPHNLIDLLTDYLTEQHIKLERDFSDSPRVGMGGQLSIYGFMKN